MPKVRIQWSSNVQPVLGEGGMPSEWSKNGSLINKPPRGWLHPDSQVTYGGVKYGIRYIGCLEVNTSMKSLDFDFRSQVAKECINKVCETAGLKTIDKKRKVDKRITRMLAEKPNMDYAGSNVNLVITSSYMTLTVMESGEVIANHEMPNVSFASGGDADTLDFIAYVAKDGRFGRACFVLECGGGLAQDVITTIGQAFELRFKEYLKKTPRAITVPDRLENPVFNGNDCAWGEDSEYYNDLPGKTPPEVQPPLPPLPDYQQNGVEHSAMDISSVPEASSKNQKPSVEPEYVNSIISSREQSCSADSFDMQPIETALHSDQKQPPPPPRHRISEPAPNPPPHAACVSPSPFVTSVKHKWPAGLANHRVVLLQEEWFHGPISRKESEALVVRDGDFLVRESQGSPGQYVLTGMQNGIRKHLLLVDPEGVVRTKDRTFESVTHLVSFHCDNGLPIISAESTLVLRNPIPRTMLPSR
ncbi:SHC-transforming protein 1-like isoform X1 [Argiope bruennichi]|uniref:SHC-transforming protein 1 like protein n=1 Tax=Argiope bruennichi TaxID=94029 RepID=A0A8T0EIS6_ARGBR|nr:SHC-transforming protein 1-like isoform X1 [Argiope bruennichi]XP_055953901.1 SHC-transforming protein 1-like isoform X1 [Argiope bruennichi]XP_055953902.1 SHC-transforming protein 1-like isoform X1 [Argiope bruennichi]XP_055953903.1 SHC-transforming protein 1-like isoform X1 [Argiope bruennichi]KAF8771785.1 SHC-transforming protein 1 like protein [Argiope bruennichi]